ncbi:phospholipase D family protein [Heyndrickxia acidiproducens]|uniref:phospholipase D family protein n=1 Tax=Heyndrickxia acidiproducens TaxID=1121084 RepID=UPI00036E1615|nr:phospholipase D family protein [Heyndrickxia acidiproducens]
MAVKKGKKKRWLYRLLVLFVAVYAGTILYHTYKPLPNGISYKGKTHYVNENDLRFLSDLTYREKGTGKRRVEQSIYPEIYRMINDARQFIVADIFLFNGYHDKGMKMPERSKKLADRLIEKKEKEPHMKMIIISDPINTSYGSHEAADLKRLQQHGIQVVFTNLDPLRDPTPLYSGIWRMFFQWFGQGGKGWLPNAFGDNAPKMTIRSYLELFNIKANHRKTFVTENGAVIASGNPHDASGYHSNHAFWVNGPVIGDVLKSEQPVSDMSNGPKLPVYKGKTREKGEIAVQLLTEGKVYSRVMKELNAAKKGDSISMAMFYLADRKVVHALEKASRRGVRIRLILDPNRNAFGHKKIGLPNQPVARELAKKTDGKIQIRWYKTGAEQFHPKLIWIEKQGRSILFDGSTNLTDRNLDDYNLETNLFVEAPNQAKITKDIRHYFERLWTNKDGNFTMPYKKREGFTIYLLTGIYRLQELLKLTTY